VLPNQGTFDTNATYKAEQLEVYEQENKGPFTVVHPLSTNIAGMPLCNATSTCQELITAAADQDPAQYLAPGTDAAVVRGYAAQRTLTLAQLRGISAPIGQIHWGTANVATLYFVKPLSRGTVQLAANNGTDPLTAPAIDWRSMTDPTDLKLVVALFRAHRAVFAQPTMAALGPVELAPFASAETDEEIRSAVRDQLNPTNAHQCCTAAMLPRDLGGVVDDQMRVYGVEGLRVVDISAWPMIVSGAPTATIYGQGERVSWLNTK
jgi:choline dehydrogenase